MTTDLPTTFGEGSSKRRKRQQQDLPNVDNVPTRMGFPAQGSSVSDAPTQTTGSVRSDSGSSPTPTAVPEEETAAPSTAAPDTFSSEPPVFSSPPSDSAVFSAASSPPPTSATNSPDSVSGTSNSTIFGSASFTSRTAITSPWGRVTGSASRTLSVGPNGETVTVTAKADPTGLPPGAIAGLAVGVIAFIGILAGVIVWLCLRYRKPASSPAEQGEGLVKQSSSTYDASANRGWVEQPSLQYVPYLPNPQWQEDGDNWAELSQASLAALLRKQEQSKTHPSSAWPNIPVNGSSPDASADDRPTPSGTQPGPSTHSVPVPPNPVASPGPDREDRSPIVEHDHDVGRMKILLPPAYDPSWEMQKSETGSSYGRRTPSVRSGASVGRSTPRGSRPGPVPRIPSQYRSMSGASRSSQYHSPSAASDPEVPPGSAM